MADTKSEYREFGAAGCEGVKVIAPTDATGKPVPPSDTSPWFFVRSSGEGHRDVGREYDI